jgi:hypothetical protein
VPGVCQKEADGRHGGAVGGGGAAAILCPTKTTYPP